MISCDNLQCCTIIASLQKSIDSLNRIRVDERQCFESKLDCLKRQNSELQSQLKILECNSIQQEKKNMISEIERIKIVNKFTSSVKNITLLENELTTLRNTTCSLQLEVSFWNSLNFANIFSMLPDKQSKRRNFKI